MKVCDLIVFSSPFAKTFRSIVEREKFEEVFEWKPWANYVTGYSEPFPSLRRSLEELVICLFENWMNSWWVLPLQVALSLISWHWTRMGWLKLWQWRHTVNTSVWQKKGTSRRMLIVVTNTLRKGYLQQDSECKLLGWNNIY